MNFCFFLQVIFTSEFLCKILLSQYFRFKLFKFEITLLDIHYLRRWAFFHDFFSLNLFSRIQHTKPTLFV